MSEPVEKREKQVIRAIVGLIVLALALAGGAVAQEERVYTRMGGANAISHEEANDLASLKQQVESHWADFKRALIKGKWQGDPEDLRRAVMDDSFGQVTEVDFPVGGRLEWMAFRWEGRAQVKRNIRWGGAEPFGAWKIAFSSGGQDHVFIVPKVCLNLALYKPLPPKECTISVTPNPVVAGEPFTLACSGSNVQVEMDPAPADGQPFPGWLASPFNTKYSIAEAGKYTFKGWAQSELGERSTESCSVVLEVKPKPAPPPPAAGPAACQISLSAAEAKVGETFTISMSGSGAGANDSLESTSVAITDAAGAVVESMDLDASMSASTSLAKRGIYTVTGKVMTKRGQSASCDAQIEIKRRWGGPGWIVRPHLLWIQTQGDGFEDFEMDVDGAGVVFVSQVIKADTSEAFGLGLDVERQFNDRWGFVFGAWQADLDFDIRIDTTTQWLRFEEDIGMLGLNAGLNYHLALNKPFDLYVGPLASWIQYDDITITALGETVRSNFDDEFALGAQIGLDIPFSDRAAFAAGLRYLDLDLQDPQGFKLSVDPLVMTAGLAFRF